MNFRMLGRGVLSFALLAAASFTIAAISPECSRVKDEVTRPEILGDPTGGAGKSSSYQKCEDKCRKESAKLVNKETNRHKKALKDCTKGGSGSKSKAGNPNPGTIAQCIATENALHSHILAEIAQDLIDCIAACHSQGGGGGS